jgi:hypothetical protein
VSPFGARVSGRPCAMFAPVIPGRPTPPSGDTSRYASSAAGRSLWPFRVHR